MKSPRIDAREMALASLRRLERLTDLGAPAEILEREHACLDRHLSRLGNNAEAVIFDLPRARLRLLGQEAQEQAWVARCDTCQHRVHLDSSDESTWERWCSHFKHGERPFPEECRHHKGGWPS